MRALTVVPGQAGSLDVSDLPDPEPGAGDVLVQGLALGVCGTDGEIVAGHFGSAAPGRDRLVLGHESLGMVLRAPAEAGVGEGDLVAGMVRRPDPEPCGACAHGEMDMCRNGRYTERGIKSLDGFGAQLWRTHPRYAVRVDEGLRDLGVLMEPASVVAKAWEQVSRVGARAWFEPRRALVTGAGPIGLLAALLAAQRGLEVHVLDLVADGPKPELVRDLGGTYHRGDVAEVARRVGPDVVVEATGVGQVALAAMAHTTPYGVVCLTGISAPGAVVPTDVGALNRDLVLQNAAVVGSVSANRRHWEAGGRALAAADPEWLGRLVSRRVPLSRCGEAFDVRKHDVKVVVDLT